MPPPWKLPLVLPREISVAIQEAYRTPPRAYHNIEHVGEVWTHYESVEDWDDPGSVALAVMFHDAVYDAGQPNNETRSADLAMKVLEAHPIPDGEYSVGRTLDLIMLTARHGQFAPADVELDEAHFLDCDMAIIGASPERFAAYEAGIRAEYGHVPDDAYRAGRSAFLCKLLAKREIFLSKHFRERFEARARENVAGLLGRLG
jgi:predicted metal-dependent HD superfamily phosphohydrolase